MHGQNHFTFQYVLASFVHFHHLIQLQTSIQEKHTVLLLLEGFNHCFNQVQLRNLEIFMRSA